MEYVLAALAGLAYGALIGVGKHLILWHRLLKSPDDFKITMVSIYTRMGISFVINAATLFVVFLLRDYLPFDFVVALLAAGIGLSLAGKLSPMKDIMQHVKEEH